MSESGFKFTVGPNLRYTFGAGSSRGLRYSTHSRGQFLGWDFVALIFRVGKSDLNQI